MLNKVADANNDKLLPWTSTQEHQKKKPLNIISITPSAHLWIETKISNIAEFNFFVVLPSPVYDSFQILYNNDLLQWNIYCDT